VHELAATLAQSGCLVLALEADLEAWEYRAGVCRRGRAFWPPRCVNQ
jgi:dihydroxycyclohexadiene carboxylate dehydrogenase